MLKDLYFSDIKSVDVVYAQRGSCQEYSKCVRASSTSFSTCSAFGTISRCMGNQGWMTIIFDECKADRCDIAMPPNATRCHYAQWRKVDAKTAKPCTHDLNDNMLKYRPMANLRALNGSHCLLPLPKGSKIYKQINCKGEKKDEPYYTWTYEFSRSLYEDNYSCLMLSRCKRMENPMDFVCIAGKNGAEILRKAAKTRIARDEKDEAEKNSKGENQTMPFPKKLTIVAKKKQSQNQNSGERMRRGPPITIVFEIVLVLFSCLFA